jgi:hypothetical protein
MIFQEIKTNIKCSLNIYSEFKIQEFYTFVNLVYILIVFVDITATEIIAKT